MEPSAKGQGRSKGKGKIRAKDPEKGKPPDKPWVPPKGPSLAAPSTPTPNAVTPDLQYENRAWHGYIKETLQAWQGYAKDFAQTDAEMEKELEQARHQLLEAKAALEEAKTVAVNADGFTIPDEDAEEDFMTDIKGEGAGKIRLGINQLVSSLEQMQAQVEEDLVEPPPSKSRKVEIMTTSEGTEAAGKPSGLPISASTVPFARPASQTDTL